MDLVGPAPGHRNICEISTARWHRSKKTRLVISSVPQPSPCFFGTLFSGMSTAAIHTSGRPLSVGGSRGASRTEFAGM